MNPTRNRYRAAVLPRWAAVRASDLLDSLARARKTLNELLRGRFAALRGARFLADLLDRLRALLDTRFLLLPARGFLQRFPRYWGLLVPLVVLSGCVDNPTRGGNEGIAPPVSQQPATTEAERQAKAHTELGTAYLAAGRFAVALEEARIALAADGRYAPAYNLLALVHMELRERNLAEENFRKALALAPNDPEINNNYGWFLCQNGRERESFAHFQRAARNPLYPSPARALANEGVCRVRVKDDAGAEEVLARASLLDPTTPVPLFWLADIRYRQGRYNDARRLLAEVHRLIEPNAESAWLALRIERKAGDREAEMRWLREMRRRFQDSAEYQKLQQGQYE